MPAAIPECTLGSTGITTTALGIGGYIGGLEHPGATAAERRDAGVAAVQRAAGLGIRYFDTSPAYGAEGEAQELLGLGLRSLTEEQRAGITLSTKAGTHPERHHRYDRDSILWSVDESLRLLFSDHIDVLLVHDPAGDEHMDQALAPGGAVEALEELKEQGAIGAIGLGVQSHALQRRAIDSGRFDVILPSYDYHLTRTSAAPLLRAAAARGIGVINASPYNGGILAGLPPSESVKRRGVSPDRSTRRRPGCGTGAASARSTSGPSPCSSASAAPTSTPPSSARAPPPRWRRTCATRPRRFPRRPGRSSGASSRPCQ